jgi:PAS domain S-box-containing protein
MNKRARPLRLLIVEDTPTDAELMLRELRRSGFEVDWKRVETEGDYLAALSSEIEFILSDYAMPQFSGLRALELLRERKLDIPFIIVSGTIGEETAVAAMQSGAVDYLLKDRLVRLGQAVEHALEEKRIREARRGADEMLHRLERHHELILNSAGEGIYGLDLGGSVTFANPKAGALLGWEVNELLGRPGHATIHHKHADGSYDPTEACPIEASMRDGATRRVTNDVFWRKNGTNFRVDYVSAPIRDQQDQICGTIVTFKDITEQFVAEARQKLQAEQYRLLFETNPNPMWIYATKTLQILATNEAATLQYGYSRSEFLELTLKSLGSTEEAGALSSSHSTPQTSGQFRHRKKNGSFMLVETYSGPIIWEGVAARIVTVIDITERKRAEERLREQADIIDRAHDAVIVRDFATDRVMVWNKGAERLYGWSGKEAIGRLLGELLNVAHDERKPLLAQLVSTGEFHGEIKHRAKDGHEVIVDARVTLVRNDDGTPHSVLGINTDITERKRLETQLLRTQRLESIGTLASGVAHDLNNVLTPIVMCADLLRNEVTTPDAQSSLSLIEHSAQRGAAIVRQVLTFARGVEGERVMINPIHLIDEIMDIAKRTFPKAIQITSHYPEDLWTIEADPTQLHQVLLNLSVNARDVMPNGGSLVFKTENFIVDEHYASTKPEAKPGPYVMLQVSDSGLGMPPAIIERIFDPFFTTKDVGKGTGLGLSTSLGVVKSHGGFISVHSEVNAGTTFKVFLPAQVNEAVVRGAPLSTEKLSGNGELVLVVDDEPGILAVTRIILERHNYRVLGANDGPEALGLIEEQHDAIAIVLTDISMLLMDGTALIRTIKKMRPNMPFIASTGQDEQGRLGELEALGIKRFLVKPYNQDRLLTALRDALSSQA